MEQVHIFDQNVDLYESWFEENNFIFQSEIAAVRQLLPKSGKGIEIGAGSGLFSQALGIKFGIEPSEKMRHKAVGRGIKVCEGVAEDLPISDGRYNFALMVTVDCFLKDVLQAFKEVGRILSENGFFLVAFIDKETPLGNLYEQKKQTSAFYKQARFHSAHEIKEYLELAGFAVVDERQTIFSLENIPQGVRCGTGEGVFGVIKAQKISGKPMSLINK